MSYFTRWESLVRSTDVSERRTSNRYPLECPVTTRPYGKRALHSGTGRGKTVNMSSKGLLLKTDQELALGERVEASIMWPMLLNGRCSLKMNVLGRVVRVENGLAAIEILKYQFKTAGLAAGA